MPIISQDKLKELREWATFTLSLFTVAILPVFALILSNQRMQIERAAAETFLSKTAYEKDRSRQEKDREEDARHMGEIRGKLDSMLLEQVRTADNVAILKEQINARK